MDASGTAAPASPMARPEDVIAAMVNNMNQMHTQGNQMVNNLNQLHAQNAQLAANLEAMSQTLQDVTIRPSTANPRIPFKLELPKFAGTSRENVANWIKQMDSKFNLANVPEDSRGLWAIESLTSLAAQVVANSGIEEWYLLKELLRERFVPKNQSIYLREKLFAMKQGNGDLNAYLLKFQEVLAELDPMPTEDDKLVYFINGLRERTREAVLYESPTTLDNATQIALAFEQAHFAHGTNNRANTAVPMDLDVIEVDTRTRERPEPPMTMELTFALRTTFLNRDRSLTREDRFNHDKATDADVELSDVEITDEVERDEIPLGTPLGIVRGSVTIHDPFQGVPHKIPGTIVLDHVTSATVTATWHVTALTVSQTDPNHSASHFAMGYG